MSFALKESVDVQLDVFGNGIARLGPTSHGETWHPENASVKVSSAILEAICNVYVGHEVIAANIADATFTGSSGNATGKVKQDLWLGNYIWAVWTGGDANATATLTVRGTKDVG